MVMIVLIVASAFLNELVRGTKHYDINTGNLITDPVEICNAMRDDRLIIEYPKNKICMVM